MENSMDALKLAVAAIIVAVVIGVAFQYVKKGTNLNNQASSTLDSALAGLSNSDKQMYDGTSMTGSDVIDCINKFKDTDVYVVVNTRDGVAYIYNNLFDPATADASTITEDVKEANALLWELGGWPINYWGSDLQSHAIGQKLPDGADASTTVRFGSLTNAPRGGYDATSTSGTPGYLSPNANFVSSIQIDANNDVRAITFIQK